MSLRRLKLERIDLYQLHRIDPRTPLEESLGALRQMQEQGKSATSASAKSLPPRSSRRRRSSPSSASRTATRSPTAATKQTLDWCEQHNIAFLPWYPIAGGKLLKPDHPFAQILTATRRALQRHPRAALDRLAPAPLARHAPHPRHIAGQASRRKHRRSIAPDRPRRMGATRSGFTANSCLACQAADCAVILKANQDLLSF